MNPPDSVLWPEKFQVTTPDTFVFHRSIVESLCRVAECQQFINIIFHGPYGSGKLSLARMLIYMLYRGQPDARNIFKPIRRELNLSLDSEISFYKSKFHFEVDLEDYEFNKNIIQQFITEIAENKHFSNTQQFQIIVFYNMESLSTDIQFTLRRTLEMYSDNCRFIFICHRLSMIEDAIKSRCCLVRVPSPSSTEINNWITDTIVSRYPNWTVDVAEKKKLLKLSKGNLHHVLFGLQYIYYREWQKENGGLDEDGESVGASYNLAGDPDLEDMFQREYFLSSMIKSLGELNLEYIHNLRNNIYLLLSNDMPVQAIFEQTVQHFLMSKKMKPEQKEKLVQVASYYLINVNTGYRQIYHIESFFLWIYGFLKYDRCPVELLTE